MDRQSLVKALTLTSRALSKGDLIPIHKCFAFDGNTVMAYDGLIGIKAPFVQEEPCALNGAMLLGWLQANRADEVTLEIQGQDAVLKGGRSTFRLPFFPYEDYLFEEPKDEWELVLKLSPDFMLGLELCLATSSRDTAQQALLGVCVTPGPQGVLYSSDGDAISQWKLDAKLKGAEAFMLPNAFCSALITFHHEFEGLGGTLRLNKAWARADLEGGYTIYANMIENENPVDFAAQIKKTTKGSIDFFDIPDGLDEALSRARVVADPESAKTELAVEKDRLRLVTTTTMGTTRDTISFKGHPEITVNVNAALMQRSIQNCSYISVNENYCAFKSEKMLIITGNMD